MIRIFDTMARFLQYPSHLSGNACWISASPVTCLTDLDVACIRGDTMAIVYRKWFSLYLIPFGFAVISLNMFLIVWNVLVQTQRSDRWRLKSSKSRCRVCHFKLWLKHKPCLCCCKFKRRGHANVIEEDNPHSLLSATNPSNVDNGVGSQSFPSIKACLKPAEIPIAPNFHNKCATTKILSTARNIADKTNGPIGTNAHAPKSMACASRSATTDDRYAFNIGKVRSSIRRESRTTLSNQTLPGADSLQKIDAMASSNAKINAKTLTPRSSCTSLMLVELSTINPRSMNLVERSLNIAIAEEAEVPPSNHQDNEVHIEEEVISQALLYIFAFVITYIFPFIGRVVQIKVKKQVPFCLLILSQTFMPLQGFFNVFVYTRPHVKSIRKNNPDYSWFKAFWIAFKAGGDNDSVGQTHGFTEIRISDAEKKKRQDRIRKDFQRRMSTIERLNNVSDGYDPAGNSVLEDSALVALGDDGDGDDDDNGSLEKLRDDEELGY